MALRPWPLALVLLGALSASQSLALAAGPGMVLAYGTPADGDCLFGPVQVTLRPPPGQPAAFEGVVTPDCRFLLLSVSSGGGVGPDCEVAPARLCANIDGLARVAGALAGAARDDAERPFGDEDGDPDPCPEATADVVPGGEFQNPCRGDSGHDYDEGTLSNPNIVCQEWNWFQGLILTRRTGILHDQEFESGCIDVTNFGFPAPPQLRAGATACEAEGKYRLDPAFSPSCDVVQDQANVEGQGHGFFYKERKNLDDTRFHSLHSGMAPNGQPPYNSFTDCSFDWQGQTPVGNIHGNCQFFT